MQGFDRTDSGKDGELKSMYDVAVIGAGVAGYTAALEAAKRGRKAALIEKDMVGGTCLNKGCIPTKTYLREAREIMMGIHGKDRGHAGTEMKRVVQKLRQGLMHALDHDFIDLFEGTAEMADPHTIHIKGSQTDILADHIVIASGSTAIIPDIPGADSKHVFTTDHVFDPENIFPETMAVIGGGVVGIEFAYLLNAAGTKVYVFEMQPCILPGMSKSLSEIVENDLASQGVVFYKGSSVVDIDDEDGECIVSFTVSGQKKQVIVEKVLMAAGRKADMDVEGISRLGIKVEDGRLKVNHNYQTDIEHIYAIGDVSSPIQLAYVAAVQAGRILDHMYGGGQPALPVQMIPRCVYIRPEIAVIGISEEEAEKGGMDVRIRKYLMGANGMSQLENTAAGYIKLVISNGNETILGAELYCEHAIDMIPLIESFMMNQTDIKTIARMYFPHPSYVEGIRECIRLAEVFEDNGNEIHNGLKKRN